MPDHSDRINEINEILTGPEQVSVDGQMVRYNFESLRKERDRLMNEDTVNGYRVRSSVRSIRFG